MLFSCGLAVREGSRPADARVVVDAALRVGETEEAVGDQSDDCTETDAARVRSWRRRRAR